MSTVGAIPKYMLLIHICLLSYEAWWDSPTRLESTQIIAGLSHFELGTFDMGCVDPPLSRLLSALPVSLLAPPTDWQGYYQNSADRLEFTYAMQFLERAQSRCVDVFRIARLPCIAISSLGLILCSCWAGELYGSRASALASVLWAISPFTLANGHVATPFMTSTVVYVLTIFVFRQWLRQPRLQVACLMGTMLGIHMLDAFDSIFALFAIPVIWIVRHSVYSTQVCTRTARWVQPLGVLLIALVTLNAGYGFEGCFTRLGDYRFVSHALGKCEIPPGEIMYSTLQKGNRFSGGTFSKVPIPVPKNWLLGWDRQRLDHERGLWSFVEGRWGKRVGWHYHIFAFSLKTPLGFSLLYTCVIILSLWKCRTMVLGEELLLIGPIIGVTVVSSLKTGQGYSAQELLPAIPFVTIWVSKLSSRVFVRLFAMRVILVLALTWGVASSLFAFPHSLSYFNEIAGGPLRGHCHLGGSEFDTNIDCGQDLFYLRRWLRDRPEVHELHAALGNHYDHFRDPVIPGLSYRSATPDVAEPGWFAVNVNHLHDRFGRFDYFSSMQPVGCAGYSIYIFRITSQQVSDKHDDRNSTWRDR